MTGRLRPLAACAVGGIYDNMTTAVKRVLLGRDREINPCFERM